jgi:hypothetical protein
MPAPRMGTLRARDNGKTEGTDMLPSLMVQVNTMKYSIFVLTVAICIACSGTVTEPSDTDNHNLVTSETGAAGAASSPGQNDTSVGAGNEMRQPRILTVEGDLQAPCVEYCNNYQSCIEKGSLDCETVCTSVIGQLDQSYLQPVYSAFNCLQSRVCSDGIPDLSASAGAGATDGSAKNDCRLEALAVDCRLSTGTTLAPNPFSFFAMGAGINDCYLEDEPSHDTPAIKELLKTGLTGVWRCSGSSHTYSVSCVDVEDRVGCQCMFDGLLYNYAEAPLSWPQATDQDYWQYVVERCGWRY